MTTTERAETVAATWRAPGWADHADYYQGEIAHILLIEHPDSDDVVVMLTQDDDLELGEGGRVRAVRGAVEVDVEAPGKYDGVDGGLAWGDFTVDQARTLTTADLPGVHADAWPKVQQVIARALAAYDAAVTSA